MQRDRAKLKFFRNKWREDEDKTIPNLALTPSQMLDMAEHGIPISNGNLSQLYDDGTVNPSWDIDLDRQRGVDVNQMWEHNQEIKSRFKKAYKEATTTKGGD